MAKRENKKTITEDAGKFARFLGSVWLFPVVLAIPLLILTAFQISGSSVGMYHQLFGGPEDKSLLLNAPRPIRSDEWVVGTQMFIAQEHNNYERINKNIGNGEDMSIIIDAPYKEWSVAFKPHDLAFFVLPFDNAFAFRWWFLAYALIVSCYFFVLALLPRKRLVAALLGVSLFCTPFVHWWYTNGTLGTLACSLFMATIFIKMLHEKRWRINALWALALAYVITCFALIIYPPFQIPCLLAVSGFAVGYLIERCKTDKATEVFKRLGMVVGGGVLAGILVMTYVATRQDVVHTITNTAYPGHRVVAGGEYNMHHLFSSHLSPQLQSTEKASFYSVTESGVLNQSEASNFILLLPFLFLPAIFLLERGYLKDKKIDWPLLTTSVLFVLFMVRLKTPMFDGLFKLLQLDKVPQNRLIIGLGLLSIIYTVLFIRNLAGLKAFPVKKYAIYIYVLLVFAFEVYLGLYARDHYPGFITTLRAWLFSIPIPVIIFLLLTKRFKLALFGLLLFSAVCVVKVNPLYAGTDIISKTPLSLAIQDIANKDPNARWVTETSYLQNFAYMNGAKSLTGVYSYPQLDIWDDSGAEKDIYNRYAHTNAVLNRDVNETIPTRLELVGGDHFGLFDEPCSAFLRRHDVRYILAEAKIDDSCAQLVKSVTYPVGTYYIYRIN